MNPEGLGESTQPTDNMSPERDMVVKEQWRDSEEVKAEIMKIQRRIEKASKERNKKELNQALALSAKLNIKYKQMKEIEELKATEQSKVNYTFIDSASELAMKGGKDWNDISQVYSISKELSQKKGDGSFANELKKFF